MDKNAILIINKSDLLKGTIKSRNLDKYRLHVLISIKKNFNLR